MEVFITFTKDSDFNELKSTLEAWEAVGCEPVAIEVTDKNGKYHLIRRVTAEKLANQDYILADIGCVPVEKDFDDQARKLLDDLPQVGLIKPEPGYGVRIIRKGAVKHWPQKETETYDKEHEHALHLRGYNVLTWSKLHYRRLGVS